MSAQFVLASESPQLFAGPARLVDGRQLLGRSPKCQIVIAHATVSRFHAEITLADQSVRVRDLQSLNGTYLNDRPVAASELRSGDRLRMGAVSLILVKGSVTAEEGSTDRCGSVARSKCLATIEMLSPGEYRIFELLCDGLAEKRIASQLNLSPHTVHNHVKAIYRRLGVHSRPELLAKVLHGQGESPAIAKLSLDAGE